MLTPDWQAHDRNVTGASRAVGEKGESLIVLLWLDSILFSGSLPRMYHNAIPSIPLREAATGGPWKALLASGKRSA